MDRNTLLWTIALLLGGTVLSGTLRRATEDSSTLVVVAVQVGAFAAVVGLIVLIVRRFS